MDRFVHGEDRAQGSFFPNFLDDFVTADNPVRAVDAFIEELDLVGLGFEGMTPSATGRPAYHPSTMLKIYLYGYLNRIQFEPAAGARNAAQHRADVADRTPVSRLQDNREFPEGQRPGDPGRLQSVHRSVPSAFPVHPVGGRH